MELIDGGKGLISLFIIAAPQIPMSWGVTALSMSVRCSL